MKKLVLLSTLLFTGLSFGQTIQKQNQTSQPAENSFFDRVSLEPGWGLHVPLSKSDGVSRSDLIGIGSFYVGANYKLNNLWGVRGTYAYNNFKHHDFSDLQFGIHKFMAEATLSLGSVFAGGNLPSDFRKFDVSAHAGLGVSLGKRKIDSATDKMGNFQFGLMPSYKLSETLNLNLDVVYVMNFSQASTFAGLYEDKYTGNYLIANIGFSLALGQ